MCLWTLVEERTENFSPCLHWSITSNTTDVSSTKVGLNFFRVCVCVWLHFFYIHYIFCTESMKNWYLSRRMFLVDTLSGREKSTSRPKVIRVASSVKIRWAPHAHTTFYSKKVYVFFCNFGSGFQDFFLMKCVCFLGFSWFHAHRKEKCFPLWWLWPTETFPCPIAIQKLCLWVEHIHTCSSLYSSIPHWS